MLVSEDLVTLNLSEIFAPEMLIQATFVLNSDSDSDSGDEYVSGSDSEADWAEY